MFFWLLISFSKGSDFRNFKEGAINNLRLQKSLPLWLIIWECENHSIFLCFGWDTWKRKFNYQEKHVKTKRRKRKGWDPLQLLSLTVHLFLTLQCILIAKNIIVASTFVRGSGSLFKKKVQEKFIVLNTLFWYFLSTFFSNQIKGILFLIFRSFLQDRKGLFGIFEKEEKRKRK